MITKSKYVSYCKCPRLFYLNEHNPELATQVSDFQQQIMDEGTYIGEVARDYFGPSITIEKQSNVKMYQDTLKAIEDGEKVICEASFIYEDLFCAVDVLKVNDDGSLEIYECKSTGEVKEYYEWDCSFQNYVLSKLGYKINKVKLMLINKNYVFKDKFDIKKYFKISDVNLHYDIEENIDKIHRLLSLPLLECNENCKGCIFFNECLKFLPENNVYKLSGCRNIHELVNEGIYSFEDYLNSYYASKNNKTTNKIKQQIDFTLNDRELFIDKPKVKEFLDKIEYPLYYLDFETTTDSIPFINGTTPGFSRIFQYSLHIQEYENGPCIHKEYLQDGKYDNLKEVVSLLIDQLGSKGTILAYNMSYEKGHIEALEKFFPDKNEELEKILSRFMDLEVPFKNRWVYCKEMKGKSSIKYVLPAMVEGFEEGYKSLPYVHNGTEAMNAYIELLDKNNPNHNFIYNSLLKYCEMDTLAMVKILEKIYKLMK